MDNFFKAVAIISITGLVIIGFYMIRQLWFKVNTKKATERIKLKRYEDEKNYQRQYLMALLPRLQSGTLRWILVHSRLAPDYRVEITNDVIHNNILIISRGRPVTDSEQRELSILGVREYRRNIDQNLLYVPANSKIITDSLYFIFETIYGLGQVVNIKIVTSGD